MRFSSERYVDFRVVLRAQTNILTCYPLLHIHLQPVKEHSIILTAAFSERICHVASTPSVQLFNLSHLLMRCARYEQNQTGTCPKKDSSTLFICDDHQM
jgi:hypothetical protein